MKSFQQYLTESAKIYKFRIKLAIEPTGELIDRMEKVMGKFGLVSLSKPKRTPVQATPTHFRELKNTEVWSMDAEFSYPTRNVEVKAAICSLGVNDAYVLVMNENEEEVLADRDETIEMVKKDSPLLLRDFIKSNGKASDEYAKQGEKTVQNSVTGKIKVPGAPAKAETTNDLPQGRTSPVGSNPVHKPTAKSIRR